MPAARPLAMWRRQLAQCRLAVDRDLEHDLAAFGLVLRRRENTTARLLRTRALGGDGENEHPNSGPNGNAALALLLTEDLKGIF